MNIIEAKALFFARYYYQTVLILPNYSKPTHVNSESIKHYPNDDCYLLLRLVSQLPDEEVMKVADIMHLKSDKYFSTQYGKTTRSTWVEQFLENGNFNYYGGKSNQVIIVYQYLLRIGILLPFTYLNEDNQPITLSPNDIINLKWAQIKEV